MELAQFQLSAESTMGEADTRCHIGDLNNSLINRIRDSLPRQEHNNSNNDKSKNEDCQRNCKIRNLKVDRRLGGGSLGVRRADDLRQSHK